MLKVKIYGKKIYLTGETNGINIIPDIIIHERGINSENLCVIEVKKVSQRDTDIEYARTKLKACTTSVSENLNFQLGILILFTTGNTPDYQIELYKNGELL